MKITAAFTLNMMCRDIYMDLEEHARTISQNGQKMSPPVTEAFQNLCLALKKLDEVTSAEIE